MGFAVSSLLQSSAPCEASTSPMLPRVLYLFESQETPLVLSVSNPSGCIYNYDAAHPPGGKMFVETDPANFTGSFYNTTKSLAEQMLTGPFDPYVLTLRMRLPCSGDLRHPRNLLTKIKNFSKVVDVPNSITVLPSMLPLMVKMAEQRISGVHNFTSPGAISYLDILKLYRKHVDSARYWTFSQPNNSNRTP